MQGDHSVKPDLSWIPHKEFVVRLSIGYKSQMGFNFLSLYCFRNFRIMFNGYENVIHKRFYETFVH